MPRRTMRRFIRHEKFGFIVAPPFTETLLFLGKAPVKRPLSAPVEVHISLASHCPNRCSHCYENSNPACGSDHGLGLEEWKSVISLLGKMGVFHCAFGGGEPLALPWLFDIARHARNSGIVPNLTTSGIGMTESWVRRSGVFGQVNVSFDGRGGPRSADLQKAALEAMKLLARHRKHTGINCVVTGNNFHELDDICAAAKRAGMDEVELLRVKPAGRAASGGNTGPSSIYAQLDLADAMYQALPRVVENLIRRHKIRMKLDCSFVPIIASAGFKPWLMELCGASGCEGGNELCAIDPEGKVTGCSFCAEADCRADELNSRWGHRDAFEMFRRWEEKGDPKCLSCDHFEVCRGGCHVVSRFVKGSWYAADPSCALARR